jgi:hypothetical protein
MKNNGRSKEKKRRLVVVVVAATRKVLVFRNVKKELKNQSSKRHLNSFSFRFCVIVS